MCIKGDDMNPTLKHQHSRRMTVMIHLIQGKICLPIPSKKNIFSPAVALFETDVLSYQTLYLFMLLR